MSRWRWLLRRVVFAVLAAYGVLTATFLFVALTPNIDLQGQLGAAAWAGANESQLRQIERTYREARGLDRPLAVRYVDWMVDMTTLQWGQSFSQGVPVVDLVADRLPRTLSYVLPGVALAVLAGVGVGLYAALHRRTVLDYTGRVVAYGALGLPNFWLATVLVFLLATPEAVSLLGRPEILVVRVVPPLLVATSLVAGQLTLARAGGLEYLNADFVKLLHAKGAGPWTVARHVLRNAALPLVSLFFTDLLAVLVLDIYIIEFVLNIPGFGKLSFVAITERDMPLVLGTTLVVVFAGVLGTVLQDVAHLALDPRVGGDGE